MKHGLLIINLGTPDKAEISAVRRYLAEFLTDKRVIDLPAPLRYLLVYAFILPFRPKQSTHAYQAIWTDQGSPLLIHSRNLQQKLQHVLGATWQVELGMRYGNPSIANALINLQSCAQLTILPLYPQYSSAATGTSIEQVLRLLALRTIQPSLHIIRDFYQHAGFIKAQAALIKPHIATHDHLLFSYHGLPEQHIIHGGCQQVCPDHCLPDTKGCYRAQCYASSQQLGYTLGLTKSQYSTAFQSRLGRTPWIKPYTDELLPQLAAQGIKRLAVCCPSFVADCLETLEEIGIRAKEQWLQLGGEQLTLVPCVNDTDLWVEGLINLLPRVQQAEDCLLAPQ